ncbi:FecR family protein [Agriterribacter sp.]|uniref:FecR family protein n=1 Tax=Agriterribacter sp. TaxID=2821509 RepID=UPI002B5E908A|nr:FecR domain-containing protein [Agriterribacter sp.]HTN06575.1 FecR domain-containing protein [Agriterribacter sp.]
MSSHPSVEELVINDSFYNYCFLKNKEDIRYWEDYILNHPGEAEKIMEARELIFGLSAVTNQEHSPNNHLTQSHQYMSPLLRGKRLLKQLRYYAAAAAAVTAIILSAIFWKQNNTSRSIMAGATANNSNNKPATLLEFTSAKGERKLVTLPDGTLLHLNAGSTLRIDPEFAQKNRNVFLSGEALFDVQHNESLPFIVHVDSYDVKVLGTLFNVKAYAGDITNEVSLLRGKVEVLNRNNSKTTVLSPNHKLLIHYAGAVAKEPAQMLHAVANETKVLPLSYNKDSLVIETAWSQNRLEIVNENFEALKEKLERWYNVEIHITDAEVGRYSFTATFEKESIEQVLKALQYSYHFTYKTEGGQITISR